MQKEDFLKLIRAKNCGMAALACLIGYFIVTPVIGLESLLVIPVMIAVFLITAGGQAVNDVFDAKIDAKINKHKPIPSKKITKEKAFSLSLLLFMFGIGFSLMLNTQAQLIAVLFSGLLIIYSATMTKIKFAGNIIVALGTAFTFIFGAVASTQITLPINSELLLVIVLASSAFFINLARELTKDFEDLKKDKGHKKTLPMIAPLMTKTLLFFYFLVSSIIAIWAYHTFSLSMIYLFFTIIGILVFSRAVMLFSNQKFKESSKIFKIGMIISLVAYASLIFI